MLFSVMLTGQSALHNQKILYYRVLTTHPNNNYQQQRLSLHSRHQYQGRTTEK